jgi:ABC-type transport system substrate-binding protein
MTRSSSLAWLVVSMLASSLGPACAGVRGPIGERRDVVPSPGGTLRIATYADLRTLDPALAFDSASQIVNQLIFERLVDYDRDGHLAPALAERIDVAEDGRRYSFQLRRAVLFHDGRELTADDVKRSIERTLHHDTPCPASSFYRSIVGYDDFHGGQGAPGGEVVYAPHLTGVVVDGRYLLHIDLAEPDATFLPAMSLSFVAPVCESAGSRYAREWAAQACGTGPFRVEQWAPSRQVDLSRHAGYFRPGLPYLDAVRFYLLMAPLTQRFKFESGDLDLLREMSFSDSLAYRRDPRWQPFGQWQPARMTMGVFFNTQMKPFDNAELRRAVAAAVDWQRIASLRPGELFATGQMIPPAVDGYDPAFTGQQHDVAAALEHMNRAGYPYDPALSRGGYPETLRFVAPAESLPSDAIAPIVAQELARIGIRIEIRSVSWPTFLAETGRRNAVSLGYGGWVMDFPDPSDFFEPTLSSEALRGEETRNVAFYSNARLDRLLGEAHRELVPARRADLYRECERIVRDDAPWSIGLNQRSYELVQPYVHDYFVDKTHTADVRSVWIDGAGERHATRARRSVLAWTRPWGTR